jgi:hypothetical protein
VAGVKVHPQILKKNGRKEFVVLSYEEFQAIQKRLADAEDPLELRKAVREDDPNVPGMTIEEIKTHLGLAKRGKTVGRRSGGRACPRR